MQNSTQQDQKSNMSKTVLLPLNPCGKLWDVWNFLSDCNRIEIHKHLVSKWTFNQTGQMIKC